MMRQFLIITLCMVMLSNPLNIKAAETELDLDQMAARCDMTTDEFILLSSCVEAESDRSDSLEGRVMIALTILNRVESDQFPDTVTEVLTQRGQFSTIRNGRSVTDRTELSDEAVIQAVEWLEQGDAPAVLFFNCIGFFSWRTPYGSEPIDGNYFSL